MGGWKALSRAGGALALVVSLLAALAVPAEATGASWSIVATPSPGLVGNHLLATACVASNDCWAVGAYKGSSGNLTLAEHWNGSSWSVVATPSANGESLGGVACVASNDCWAVGTELASSTQTVIEHWNGSTWSTVSSPDPTTNDYLSAVTCVASADCWAVGADDNGALTAHWDGTSWSAVTNPTGSSTTLSGVACVASNDCWAVGTAPGFNQFANPISVTEADHWNGSAWSIESSQRPADGGSASLSGVSCVSSSDCWAVGNADGTSLTSHYDGTNWSFVTSQDSAPSGVTCASTSNCWAVAAYNGGLITHWNGSGWTSVASNDPSGVGGLVGVACAASTACVAVGTYQDFALTDQALTERWNGTAWAVTPSPDQGTSQDALNSVACTSDANCWATGVGVGTYRRLLLEHWNGTAWSGASSPDEGEAHLAGVTCLTSSDCWVVGQYYQNGVTQDYTLAEHWNGTAWSGVSTGSPGGTTNSLDSVSCAASNDCWAVGYEWSGSGPSVTLAEHWNGTTWSVVSSPNQGTNSNYLYGVSCTASANCWAVGYALNLSVGFQTLIEHWNGGTWSVVSSPDVGTSSNLLNAVTCATGTACWAVGGYQNTSGTLRTLVERWSGTAWSVVTSPSPAASDNELSGVACAAVASCWAVGYGVGTSGPAQTLAERWNGSTWSAASSPNRGTSGDNILNAVGCQTSGECWAVGYSAGASGAEATLAERYPGLPAAPTGVSAVPGATTTSTGTLRVSMTPGITNGGGITGLVAACTSSNGGVAKTATGLSSPVTVGGLTTGKTYTCTGRVTTAAGTSPASAPSLPAVVGAPASPSSVRAVPGFTTATTGPLTVSFIPGANNGSAITGYRVSCASSNGGAFGSRVGTSSSIVLTGLTTAKTYMCSVRAYNARGASLSSSPSLPVAVGAPAAPTAVTAAKVAGGTLSISFTPGASNGSAITSYRATCTSSNGGVQGSNSATASPFTVNGLTPGKSYTCVVRATNARGASLASAPSNAATA